MNMEHAHMLDQNKRRFELLEDQNCAKETASSSIGLFFRREIGNNGPEFELKNNDYKGKLMFPEWFVQVPEEFNKLWYMKVCPKGHRKIVVAEKNITRSYSKTGELEFEFQSKLPSGNYTCDAENSTKTILDCIWVPTVNVFCIIDLIMWMNYKVQPYAAEFRFCWLQRELHQYKQLKYRSSLNNNVFVFVPHMACKLPIIKEILLAHPYYEHNILEISGLLFYHRQSKYIAGKTPLFGFLRVFMVPEILRIPISPEYMKIKPLHYIKITDYVSKRRDYTAEELDLEKEWSAVNDETVAHHSAMTELKMLFTPTADPNFKFPPPFSTIRKAPVSTLEKTPNFKLFPTCFTIIEEIDFFPTPTSSPRFALSPLSASATNRDYSKTESKNVSSFTFTLADVKEYLDSKMGPDFASSEDFTIDEEPDDSHDKAGKEDHK